MDHISPEPLRVALLGCGVVGSQVARLLLEKPDDLAAHIGHPFTLVGIGVKHPDADRPGIDPALITGDTAALVGGADIVIEAMGGIEPARSLILAAIGHGACVVTANKALLAAHGPELYDAAEKAGVDLYFEAAVAGAIPIVRPLRDSLVGDEITAVMGIVNGTTNYILDEMTTSGLAFSQALTQAQERGYAEADPTADIEGYDAAAKASILASLAFHTRIGGADVHREGITRITPEDIAAARELGYVVKLLAIARLTADGPSAHGRPDDPAVHGRAGGAVSVRVHPALVPVGHPLAAVHGPYNAIVVESRNAGRLMFSGPGAGGAPTASAVVGDLVTVARNRVQGASYPAMSPDTGRRAAPIEDAITSYYVSLTVHDAPGVLARIAGVFAKHGVSLSTVRQRAHYGQSSRASLDIMTHAARDAEVADTIAELRAMTQIVTGPIRQIRVEGD